MEYYYAVIFFFIGAILSSFYGVVATRIPQGKSIIKPGSHCEKCQHALAWYDLFPVFSYLFLKGKCRYCKADLPFYEPLLELIMGLFFAGAYLYFGIGYHFFVALIILSLMDLIFVSDFGYMIILDSPLVISSICVFLLKWIYYGIEEAMHALLAGVILFLFMILVGYLGKWLFKREALGGGDIKLSFVVGMILGIPHAFMALVLSTFLALPYATYAMLAKITREVPFGPFIVGSLGIVFFYFDKFSYIVQLFTL